MSCGKPNPRTFGSIVPALANCARTGHPLCWHRGQDQNLGHPPGRQIIFAATGVTDGALMKGVRFFGEGTRTSSVVMALRTAKVRFVESIHLDKGPDVNGSGIQFR